MSAHDPTSSGLPPLDEDTTLQRLDTLRRREIDRWFSAHYQELAGLASRELGRERIDHTLQPSALVHELFLRLRRYRKVPWETPEHFLNWSSKVMRQILMDSGRSYRRHRGKGGPAAPIEDVEPLVAVASPTQPAAVRIALEKLSAVEPAKATVVELHFFGGLSVEETAVALGVSTATVVRHWRFAKAFLARELGAAGLAGA